jgi:glycolate oxidase iron-sulfur subunit
VHPRRLNVALRLARIGRRFGLRALARRTGLPGLSKLARLDAALPERPAARTWKTHYPAVGGARGTVSLFLGCFARLADTETIEAAIFLLNRFGYDVRVPDGQTCCGALHQHAGNADAAEELMQTNGRAFASGAEPLLYLASGCGARLIEYPEPFRSRARDFCEFLARAADLRSLHTDRPLGVAVHEPCTQRNVLRDAAPVYALLGAVRGLAAAPLADNGLCCGGAGSYFLDQPEIADRLGAEKIAAIERAGVRTRPRRRGHSPGGAAAEDRRDRQRMR